MAERTVLIMDDDEDVRFFMICILKKLDLQVDAATNGDEAVAMYRTAAEGGTPYTAAILDLNIPGRMGGVETARQILEIDPGALLYVASGDEFNPVMQRWVEYRFTGRLSKPFTYSDAVAVFQGLCAPQAGERVSPGE